MTRSQCKVSDTQVTVKACGPLVILYSVFRVENCKSAMLLAKEHLNIPRVISPEDFASEALDELSAMTYLSYFVRSESPGYYDTLNWVCKQLRTTQITNLTVNVALSFFAT